MISLVQDVHSGITTLTYIAEGSLSYEDTNGAPGLLLRAGGAKWMRAGHNVRHGGGTDRISRREWAIFASAGRRRVRGRVAHEFGRLRLRLNSKGIWKCLARFTLQ